MCRAVQNKEEGNDYHFDWSKPIGVWNTFWQYGCEWLLRKTNFTSVLAVCAMYEIPAEFQFDENEHGTGPHNACRE